MPPKTICREIPIERFSWDTPEKKLIAFASDLFHSEGFTRIWPDACDLGLVVKGKKETKIFILTEEEKQEGDIAAFHLKEYNGDWRMTVFND